MHRWLWCKDSVLTVISPPCSSPLALAGCAVMGNSLVAFLCSCDVPEVMGCRRGMSGHTAQPSSQGSLTWASPWVGTIGLSSRTGWEIPLLEGKEESGTLKSRWLANCCSWRGVYTCTVHLWGKCLLLWSWQTLSPRLPGSSWQLTADYQTWGHCTTASIFPLGRRTFRPRFWPV